MADRLLLDKINYEKKTVTIGGTEYAMKDVDFPTVDPKDPYRLTPEEEQVVERLRHAFVHCEKLQRHIRFLFPREAFTRSITPTCFTTAACPWMKRGISSR